MRNITAYFKPKTITEAVTLIRTHPGSGRYIAGGTHVAVEQDPSLDYLVDITYCGLNYIREDDGQVRIGAGVTLEELNQSDIIRSFASGILAEVARWTGSRQRRNSATIGGSIVFATDLVLPLIALESQILLVNSTEQMLPLTEFYTHKEQLFREGTLIKECIVSQEFRNATGTALRMSRTRQSTTILGVATVVTKTDAVCRVARIAVTPVISGITRVPPAESLLEGHPLTPEQIEQAAETVAQEIQPVDDYRASAVYRRKISRIYTKRALLRIEY